MAKRKLYGTAAVLHTMKQHRLAAEADGRDVANGLGSQSLTRHGAPTTPAAFGAAARVNRDIGRHGCDMQAEKGIQQSTAMTRLRAHLTELMRKAASGEMEEDPIEQ
jgi:hypothetical protein